MTSPLGAAAVAVAALAAAAVHHDERRDGDEGDERDAGEREVKPGAPLGLLELRALLVARRRLRARRSAPAPLLVLLP